MVKRERHDIYGMVRGALSGDSRGRELRPLHHVRRLQRRRRAVGGIRRGRNGRYARPRCPLLPPNSTLRPGWAIHDFLDETVNAAADCVPSNFSPLIGCVLL